MRLPQDRILHIDTEIANGKVNVVAEWQGELVRCKDCRYAMVRTEEEMNKPIKPQPILCEWFCIGVENDDYCSHGERRK